MTCVVVVSLYLRWMTTPKLSWQFFLGWAVGEKHLSSGTGLVTPVLWLGRFFSLLA